MSQNLRPLDITKLDFEGNRKRRRKRLIMQSLPVVIALILVCIWLVLPAIATQQASAANKSGAYSTAQQWLNVLATNTVFETYKRPFNQAIVATNQKQFDEASEFFRQAIALAPESEKCFIRVQSVLSSELAGDDAVSRQDTQAAITYYTKALSDITTYPQCFKDYSSLTLRIATKLAELVNKLKEETTYQDSDETPDSTKTSTETPSDDQMKKLETMQRNGQIKKQEANRKSESDYTYQGKQW